MTWITTLSALMREIWVVWLMLAFVGIVAWAFRPGSRDRLEPHGAIPLRNDPWDREETDDGHNT